MYEKHVLNVDAIEIMLSLFSTPPHSKYKQVQYKDV